MNTSNIEQNKPKWVFIEDKSCVQVLRSEDGVELGRRILHDMSEPVYKDNDDCLMVRVCNRCNLEDECGIVHPSQTGPNSYSEQICSRCNAQLDPSMNC